MSCVCACVRACVRACGREEEKSGVSLTFYQELMRNVCLLLLLSTPAPPPTPPIDHHNHHHHRTLRSWWLWERSALCSSPRWSGHWCTSRPATVLAWSSPSTPGWYEKRARPPARIAASLRTVSSTNSSSLAGPILTGTELVYATSPTTLGERNKRNMDSFR